MTVGQVIIIEIVDDNISITTLLIASIFKYI